MNRRMFLRLSALGAIAAPSIVRGRCRIFTGTVREPVEVSSRAVDLVHDVAVVDMLGLLTLDWHKLWGWQREPATFRRAEFRLLETSGINIFHPAVEPNQPDPRDAIEAWLTGWNRLLDFNPCLLERIDSTAALLKSPGSGRLGLLLGFQNSEHFSTPADVEHFHRLGQRVSQLTYNGRNDLGSGCYVPSDTGLTPLGVDVVAEMNRLGMAIDISHCGERTSLDAIDASRVPVLITHSNCRALVPGQPRCKSDAIIRRMALTGGVMGITVVRPFVGTGTPDLDRLLDHFDRVARIAGVEHVGLGSDVDPAAIDPATGRSHPLYSIQGLDPVARVFQIADGLLHRGWLPADVGLVLGGNFLRALTAILPPGSWRGLSNLPPPRDPFCPAPFRCLPDTLRVVD